MKKILYVISLAMLVIAAFTGVAYWHTQEQEAWYVWEQQGFNIIDEVSQKQKLKGWTTEEASFYGSLLEDSIGREKPICCPYCFIKSMFR